MTDSVRCSAEGFNTFTCEVQLDSDFETLTCEAAEPVQPSSPLPPPRAEQAALSRPRPSPAPPAANPAVSALVSSFVSKTLVHPPSPPLISGAALLACASSELSIILAAAAGAGKGPLVTGITMLKAVLDAGSCLTRAHDQAAERAAKDYCDSQAGVVVAIENDKLICEVREREE